MTKLQERVSGYIETLLKMRNNAPMGAMIINEIDRSNILKTLKNSSASVVTISGGYSDIILFLLH